MKFLNFNNWLLYALIFSTCIIASNYISSLFLFGAIIVSLLELLFCDINQNFYYSIFLLPNIRILDDIGIAFMPNILIVLPIIKFFITIRKINIEILAYMFVFSLFEFSHLAFSSEGDAILPTCCWLLSFLYAVSVLTSSEMKLSEHGLYQAITCGVLASSIIYLLNNLEYLKNLLPLIFRGMRFEAYANDPNALGLYSSIALSLLFIVPKKNYWHILSEFGLIIVILLTASKMGFVLMAFILLYSLVTQGLHSDSNGNFIRASFVLLITMCICLSKYLFQFIEHLIKRAGFGYGGTIELTTFTTGRSSLVSEYFNILSTNLLTLLYGNGMQYFHILRTSTAHQAHNTYLDIILSWGLLGTIVFSLIMWRIIKNAHLRLRISFIYYLPLCAVLLNFFGLSLFSATMFWFVLVLVLLPFKKIYKVVEE